MEKRKRESHGLDAAEGPVLKKAALAIDERQRESLRGDIRALYERYEALYDAPPEGADEAAFQALLDAAQGSCALRRLAARLIPRFVAKFPSRADTAAALLINLHEGPAGANARRHGRGTGGAAPPSLPGPDPLSVPSLEEATRHDALAGLGAVLKAVTELDAQRADACVARILDHLTRLLGELAEAGGEGLADGEAEEGEVDDRGALIALARSAFRHHTRRVLAFCVGCLAKPDRGGGRSERDARRGARFVLTRIAMQPPPRSALPASPGADGGLDLGGGADEGGLGPGGPGDGGGGAACWLSLALKADEGLQQWVAQAAATAGPLAPTEAKQVLEQFMQLLPPPPLPDSPPPPSSPPPDSGPGGKPSPQQQQPAANGGSAALPRNGVLQRVGSAGLPPAGPGASHGAPGPSPPREPRGAFPPPISGLVARVEPCLLVSGLPQHVGAAALAAEAGASEAWLLDSPACDEACLAFETVQFAARCYQRLTGEAPWGEPPPHQQQHHHQQQRDPPPGRLRLQFCSSLPPASAMSGRTPLSPFVWVSGASGCDAQGLADLLTGVNAHQSVRSMVRVGGCAPGTLIQTPSAATAQQVVDLIVRRLPPAGQGQQQQQHYHQQQGPGPGPGPGPGMGPGPGQHWQQQQQQGQPPLAHGPGSLQHQGSGQWGSPHPGRGGMPGPPPVVPALGGGGGGSGGGGAAHDPGGPPPMHRASPGHGGHMGPGSPARGAIGGPGSGGSGPSGPTLAVSCIGRDVSEGEFLAAFASHGRLLDHRFAPGADFGTVTFADPAAAARAKEALHGRRIPTAAGGGFGAGPPLRVEWMRWQGPPGPGPVAGSSPGGPPGRMQQAGPGPPWERERGRGGDHGPPLPPSDWGPPGTPMLGAGIGGGIGASPVTAGRPPQVPQHTPLHQQQQQPPLPPAGHQQQTPLSAGSSPLHPLQQPGSAAASAPPPQQALWRGRLSKSKHAVCSLICVDANAPSGGARAEPYCWPDELAVLNRSKVREVLDAYRAAPHGLRAVRRLLAAGGPGSPDDAGLAGFMDYLRSKDRAGLVKIARSAAVGHPRDLHLLVPEEGLLRELGVPPGAGRPGERALVAVVTPGRAGPPGDDRGALPQ